jgi:hypothetical protein
MQTETFKNGVREGNGYPLSAALQKLKLGAVVTRHGFEEVVEGAVV